MSKRSDRREAERLSRKLAYQQLRQERAQQSPAAVTTTPEPCDQQQTEDLLARAQAFFQTTPEPVTEPAAQPTISEAQLAANRANAQKSSGPSSAAGKSKSSRNALKHGLTSQIVVLVGEDQDQYNHQLDYYLNFHQPVGEEETRLVQSIVDCTWRMHRMLRMEAAIHLKGHLEFENKFEDRSEAERSSLILAEVALKYEKSLRNLYTQEARLRRAREKDQAELTRLQAIRKREERVAAEAAAQSKAQPTHPRSSAQAQHKNGFDFATPQTPHQNSHLQAA